MLEGLVLLGMLKEFKEFYLKIPGLPSEHSSVWVSQEITPPRLFYLPARMDYLRLYRLRTRTGFRYL